MRYPTVPTLRFFKLKSNAILPKKAHTGPFEDAAFDLFWSEPIDMILEPGERALVSTGLACAIPSGYWVKFHERSGLANKNGIEVYAGVIDPGYMGEWKVILHNSGKIPFTLKPGMAMAQFSLEEIIPTEIEEIDSDTFEIEKSKRTRQENGFGSTTKQYETINA